jgi:ferredoxin
MQISVDAARCSGHGRCYDLSPDVFGSDDEGYCAQKGETFSVGIELAEAARTGAAGCPESAIAVEG